VTLQASAKLCSSASGGGTVRGPRMATADATPPTGNGKVLPVGSNGALRESPSHTRQRKAPAGQTLVWGGSTRPIEVHYGTPRARKLRHKDLIPALPQLRRNYPVQTTCWGKAEGTWAHCHIMSHATTRHHSQSSPHQGFWFASSGLPVIDLCHERPSASASSECVMQRVGSTSSIKQQIHPLSNDLWSY
jgi:hypothetical protein